MHGDMHKSIFEVSLDPTEKRIASSTGFSISYIASEMHCFGEKQAYM